METPLYYQQAYVVETTDGQALITLTSPEEINEKKPLLVKYYSPVYKREVDANDSPTSVKIVRVDENWISTHSIAKIRKGLFQKEVRELMTYFEEAYHGRI